MSKVPLKLERWQNRAEGVEKYFTKTPQPPGKPKKRKSLDGQYRIVVSITLIFIAIKLFVFSENSLNVISSEFYTIFNLIPKDWGRALESLLELVLKQEFILLVLCVAAVYLGCSGLQIISKEDRLYRNILAKYERLRVQYIEDYKMAEPKPSDQQMDEWLDNDIKETINAALKRLNLEREDYKAEPLLIGGPVSLLGKDKATLISRVAVGKDGKTRYSHFKIVSIFLIDHRVAAYECERDLKSGEILTDQTRELPYMEITDLSTKTVRDKFKDRDGKEIEIQVQEFTISTSGQNSISVKFPLANTRDFQGEFISIGG